MIMGLIEDARCRIDAPGPGWEYDHGHHAVTDEEVVRATALLRILYVGPCRRASRRPAGIPAPVLGIPGTSRLVRQVGGHEI